MSHKAYTYLFTSAAHAVPPCPMKPRLYVGLFVWNHLVILNITLTWHDKKCVHECLKSQQLTTKKIENWPAQQQKIYPSITLIPKKNTSNFVHCWILGYGFKE